MAYDIGYVLLVVVLVFGASCFGAMVGTRQGARRELDRIARAQADLDKYVEGKLRQIRREVDHQ